MKDAKGMSYSPSKEFRIGQDWLQDAKTDLGLSRSLASAKDEGTKRRRLFVLQQSLEKLVKSSFPVFSRILPDFTTMTSLGLVIRGKDVLGDERYKKLTTDLISHFGKFTNRKELRHNPAEMLRLKTLIEKLIEFTNYIGVDVDTIESLSEAVTMFQNDNHRDLLKHSLNAYAIATTRGKLLTVYVQNRSPPSNRYPEEGMD